MKPFVLTEPEWRDLERRLKDDYPPSVFLSKEKMRRVLGFTPRTHESWKVHEGKNRNWKERVIDIHLDFFDDHKRTFFLLKYGNGKN